MLKRDALRGVADEKLSLGSRGSVAGLSSFGLSFDERPNKESLRVTGCGADKESSVD